VLGIREPQPPRGWRWIAKGKRIMLRNYKFRRAGVIKNLGCVFSYLLLSLFLDTKESYFGRRSTSSSSLSKGECCAPQNFSTSGIDTACGVTFGCVCSAIASPFRLSFAFAGRKTVWVAY